MFLKGADRKHGRHVVASCARAWLRPPEPKSHRRAACKAQAALTGMRRICFFHAFLQLPKVRSSLKASLCSTTTTASGPPSSPDSLNQSSGRPEPSRGPNPSGGNTIKVVKEPPGRKTLLSNLAIMFTLSASSPLSNRFISSTVESLVLQQPPFLSEFSTACDRLCPFDSRKLRP